MSSSALHTAGPAAGWYRDPVDRGSARWWDGAAWTGHTRNIAPLVAVDNVSASPTRRSLR
ncbi:MAG: DUF2510 domain-containing protein [Rhodoglobus sp.]